MKPINILLPALLIQASPITFAEPQISPEQICEQVKAIEFPAQDRPDAKTIQSLSGCDSETFYYGIGQAADWQKARACAYEEMRRGPEGPFQGAATLMMIYANGKGVSRNYDLAIKLACEIEGAPAEIQGRLEHLLQMKQQGADAKELDLCDDITSSMMMGFCAIHNDSIEKPIRAARLAKLLTPWDLDQKKAFDSLKQAANKYFSTRVDNEIDASGSAHTAYLLGESIDLENDFIGSLENFENGHVPSFTSQQFSDADTKLNAIYKRIQTETKDASWGTVTNKGILKTQREWLKYRDAWVQFGSIKYPAVSAASWKTYWTEKRIKMLEQFLD